MAALVMFVAALAASTVALAYPTASGTLLTASDCVDCRSGTDRPQDKAEAPGKQGIRCLCHGGAAARADQQLAFALPVPPRTVHGPLRLQPARASRQDAPPLQPPRA